MNFLLYSSFIFINLFYFHQLYFLSVSTKCTLNDGNGLTGYPTNCCPPKASAIGKSNLNSEIRVEFAAQAEFQKYIYVKVEDPQLAPKNQVVHHVSSRRFVASAAAPLCPRGSW